MFFFVCAIVASLHSAIACVCICVWFIFVALSFACLFPQCQTSEVSIIHFFSAFLFGLSSCCVMFFCAFWLHIFKQKNCCSPNDIRVSVLVRWIFVPIEQDRKKIQNEIYRKSLKIRFCSATKSIAKLHEILFDSWLNAFRFYLPWILSNASKMCLQWPEKKLYDRFEYAYIKTY